MKALNPTLWLTRLATFFLAAAVAASAGFWVLQWPQRASVARVVAVQAAPAPLDVAKVAQVLGSGPAADPATGDTLATSAFKLLGVIATGPSQGSALIESDTLPAKPYRVGDSVSDTLVLQSVSARSVVLAASGTPSGAITLTLPAPPGAP